MIYVGEKIVGKWNKKEYLVIKKIGSGGVGEVYKVRDENNNTLAIKISSDMTTINREYNILKKLEGYDYAPRAYDLDDYYIKNDKYYFVVMDYIEGLNLKYLMKNREIDISNIIGIGIIVLNILRKIYEIGYVYCDIKLENILLDMERNKIVLIDYGGVIEKENNIREYTPVYNISSWDIDISVLDYEKMMTFSVSMIIVSMILKREFNPLVNSIDFVVSKVKGLKTIDILKEIIIKGLYGSYNNIDKFINDLTKSITHLKEYKKNNKINRIIDIFFNISVAIFILIIILSGVKLIN